MKLMVNLRISTFLCIAIIVCNLFLPLYSNKVVNVNLFEFIIIGLWIFGTISHHGYFLQQTSHNEDGVITYESRLPIVQIGLVRIFQIIYYLIRKVKISWVVLLILIALDVIYIAFILLDKSNYYYETKEEDEQ